MDGAADARVTLVRQLVRRWSRPALAALAVLTGLALGAFFPLLGGDQSSIALACGLGNTPTMVANNAPAMLFPVLKNVPADQPIGIFTQYYPAGQQVSFVEDMSRVPGAPAASSLKWRWDFGDGSGYSSDIKPKHTYAHAGTYSVRSQIYDDSTASWTDVDSAQIKVIPAAIPNPPVARFTASTPVVAANGTITFDATSSHAADGSKLTYEWNFNDGGTATGAQVTHTFVVQGQGIVALMVTDGRGARSVATTNVIIVGQLMNATETTAAPGDAVSFDATSALQSGLPAGDSHIQFTWNFGDGSQTVQSQDPTASHTFTKPGQFAVQVQAVATDQSQLPPAVAAVAITVAAVAAVTHPDAQSGQNWLLVVGGGAALVGVLVVGFFLVQAQRRRNALIRERTAAMELARARHARPNRGNMPNRPMQPPRRPGSPYGDGPPRSGPRGDRGNGGYEPPPYRGGPRDGQHGHVRPPTRER